MSRKLRLIEAPYSLRHAFSNEERKTIEVEARKEEAILELLNTLEGGALDLKLEGPFSLSLRKEKECCSIITLKCF
jgi:hypothetical protein